MGEIIPVPHLFLANVWPWLTSRDVPVIPPLALQELIEALRKLGYRVDTPNNKLPALFHGKGPMRGSVTVSVEVGNRWILVDLGLGKLVSLVQDWIGSSQESSQFASALLLSSRAGEWDVSIPAGANPDELPYVDRWEGGCGPDMLPIVLPFWFGLWTFRSIPSIPLTCLTRQLYIRHWCGWDHFCFYHVSSIFGLCFFLPTKTSTVV